VELITDLVGVRLARPGAGLLFALAYTIEARRPGEQTT